MFNYFTNNHDIDIRYPTKKYFKWNLIKKMYLGELDKIKNYYRSREYNYSNNNLLVKLIKTLARDPGLPVLDYLSYIDTDAKYIIKQFELVSNLNSGKVHDNVLFEGNSSEVFLFVDNTVDPLSFETKWREFESIKVISTNITNTYYPVLFKYERYGGDITVFEIDVKAMLLQYYFWSRERSVNDRDTSANVFLPTVVIPNISNSLVDHVIWNRFKALATGAEMLDVVHKHPIHLIDYSKGIDDVLLDVIKDNTDKKIGISNLLKTIPAILHDSQYEVLQISKSYYNKQSKWVLWLSRLSDIVAIHRIIGKKGVSINRDIYNKLPYEIRALERRSTEYVDKVGPYTEELMKENIDYIKKNVGRR